MDFPEATDVVEEVDHVFGGVLTVDDDFHKTRLLQKLLGDQVGALIRRPFFFWNTISSKWKK